VVTPLASLFHATGLTAIASSVAQKAPLRRLLGIFLSVVSADAVNFFG
jgi:hypothetical protein